MKSSPATAVGRIASLAVVAALFVALPAFAQRTGGQTGVQYNADGTIDNKPVPIITEIVIPGTPVNPEDGSTGRLIDLAQYLGLIYNFLIAIVGMVAAVVIIVGGFQYLTAAGDQGKVGAAKKRMFDALVGLVLALGAYTLLNTINPALLTLTVPGGISAVRTEVTFLPFCDHLAARYGLTEDQVEMVPTQRKDIVNRSCGKAGFIKSKLRNSDGTLTDSRLWCVWRGDKDYAAQRRAAGERYMNDYGCDDDVISGERVVGSDLEVHTLAVCVPQGGITDAMLNEEYDKNQWIGRRLGRCESCNEITDGAAQSLGWPIGDEACQYWQNTAHNGDPRDFDFKFSKKKLIVDTRVNGSDDRSKRMYYCGYSANNQRCIYVPILCHRVGHCDNYDNMVMNYCEKTASDATITCRANQSLGSKWGRQTGNAAHLIPVCDADPCEVGGTAGCTVGGLAGTRNSIIGRYSGGYARMGVRVISGGLLGSITCDAN